jgi:Ca-activated chloride channel homolog
LEPCFLAADYADYGDGAIKSNYLRPISEIRVICGYTITMEFARQEYLWLLLVIPLLILVWGIGLWHQRRMRIRFGNIANLQSISRISWSGGQWIRGLLFVSALALMAMGLAYPRANIRELRAVPMPTDVVFLLDTSPSMYGRDMDPSRLGRAERIIQRFIYLKQPQDRYGLIEFNWTSVVLSYMTSDPQNILLYFDYLNQQDMPEPGTNVGSVLTNAMRLVATERQAFGVGEPAGASRRTHRNVMPDAGPDAKADPEAAQKRRFVFVLLSDGDDTAKQIDKPLADVVKSGIKIYAIGLGTANGSYVPEEMAGGLNGQVVRYFQHDGGARLVSHAEVRTMREISEKTGGRFFRGESDKQVDEAIEEILFTTRPVSGFESNAIRKDLYTYFLMGAFACLLAGVLL